jgi:hypothetical protein
MLLLDYASKMVASNGGVNSQFVNSLSLSLSLSHLPSRNGPIVRMYTRTHRKKTSIKKERKKEKEREGGERDCAQRDLYGSESWSSACRAEVVGGTERGGVGSI